MTKRFNNYSKPLLNSIIIFIFCRCGSLSTLTAPDLGSSRPAWTLKRQASTGTLILINRNLLILQFDVCTFVHCSENRYLLFLTENYAALDILEHYIRGKKQERAVASEEDSTAAPFTLFGSSFPKDKDYTQVRQYRVL